MRYITISGNSVALKDVHKVVFFEDDQLVDIQYKEAPTETYPWDEVEDLVEKRKQLTNLKLAKTCYSRIHGGNHGV